MARRFFSTNQDALIPKMPPKKLSNPNAVFEEGWVTKQPHRSVISVRGRDSTNLLQNITSTNMKTFEAEGPERAALYASLMTTKGKVMFDAIIAKPKLAG